MAIGPAAAPGTGEVVRQVGLLFSDGTVSGLGEAELLDRYADRGDGAAFEALVRRHGPSVRAVCRRLLADPHDADDAFQATFLVLARRAGTLRRREPLGPWLVGVAYRIAMKARVTAARRRKHEAEAAARAGDGSADPDTAPDSDLGPVLWEEIARLPAKYREPIVLCGLEGRSHDEAAALLRWPVGTVKGRLHRAREALRSRLVRRGITAPAVGIAAWLAAERASAAVPPPLLGSTVRAATALAAGATIAAGTVPASVAALANGALRTMALVKLSTLAASLLAAGGLAATGWAAVAAQDAPDRDGPATVAIPRSEDELPIARSALAATTSSAPASQEEQAEPKPDTTEPSRPIAEEINESSAGSSSPIAIPDRLEAARRRMELARTSYSSGKIDIDRLLAASSALLEAEFAAAEGPDDRRTALFAQMRRLSEIVQRERVKAKEGVGSPQNLADAEEAFATAAQHLAEENDAGGGGPSDTSSDDDPADFGAGFQPGGDARLNRKVITKLDRSISMPFEHETPLDDVLEYIRQATADDEMLNGIPIYVDPVGLQQAEMTGQSPITINLESVPLRTSLWLALRQLDLAYTVIDGVLIISSAELLDDMIQGTAIYQGKPVIRGGFQ